jgi:Ni/Fe-hydrogenase 1 B-type cytochrome subunit
VAGESVIDPLTEGSKQSKKKKKKIYVWEFPVRFTHWINFLCILTLSLTGIYMNKPLAHVIYTKQDVLGWVRFIHFVAAYTFLISFIIRIYWSVAGNRYADMRTWFPFTPERRRDLMHDIKHHLVMDLKATYRVGHTALGSVAFLTLQIVFLMSIFTGFAMYSLKHPEGNWRVIGGWIQNGFSLETLNTYHRVLMYAVLSFVPVHMFMSITNALKNRNRLIGSIVSGHKTVRGKDQQLKK